MIELSIEILIIYLIYYFVSVSRFDKNGHVKKRQNMKGKSNKNGKQKSSSDYAKNDDFKALPSEVQYFIRKYHVDLEKVNLRGLLKMIGLILGIDIALVLLLVFLVLKSLVWQIVVGILLIIPVYLISLRFLGKYFKKKGLIQNVSV